MKISTRGRYALRMMVDLAQSPPGEYTAIRSIANRQGISDKYLEQIITVLNRAGYVKSARGSQGGYQLARPAAEYTMGQILRLIEGDLVPVACMDDVSNRCERSGRCAVLPVYQRLTQAIDAVVDSVTLADLARDQQALDAAASPPARP